MAVHTFALFTSLLVLLEYVSDIRSEPMKSEFGEFLLFTDWTRGHNTVQLLSLQSEVAQDLEPVANPPLSSPKGIAYDHGTGVVYVNDDGARRIYKFPLDLGSSLEIVYQFPSYVGLGALALDETSGTLYIVDSVQFKIYSVDTDGTNYVELLNVKHPRGVAVDEQNGFLYWTQSSTPAIERARIWDMSTREIVVEGDLDLPFGIHIDSPGNRILWTDINKRVVESANLSGGSRSVLATIQDSELNGITVIGSDIFVSDILRYRILRIHDNEYTEITRGNRRIYPYMLTGSKDIVTNSGNAVVVGELSIMGVVFVLALVPGCFAY